MEDGDRAHPNETSRQESTGHGMGGSEEGRGTKVGQCQGVTKLFFFLD